MRKEQRFRRIALIAVLVVANGVAGLATAQEPAPETRLIQINLLAASKSGDSDLSDLPANTRKAIEDIKDFLPFKSYRILDTSLVRAMVQEDRSRPAETYISGPEGEKLQVSVSMTAEKGGTEVLVHHFEVTPSMRDRFFAVTPEQQIDPNAPAVAPRADLLDAGPFISTSFTAKVGQTVVVGSSRLNGGDEAMIVLFTALP